MLYLFQQTFSHQHAKLIALVFIIQGHFILRYSLLYWNTKALGIPIMKASLPPPSLHK